MDSDDLRDDELSSISAIFPELQRPRADDPYTFTLEIAVEPTQEVTVCFPAAAEGQGVNPTAAQIASGAITPNIATNVDSHKLAHLPAIQLQLTLPPSYPADKPPEASISTSPAWLPPSTAKNLEDDCVRLWEEAGHDLVVYSYIDHVQQSSMDGVFGLLNDSGVLEISPEHKIAVLDYDLNAKRVAFEKETFDCGVCLEPKKGVVCHRMLDCGHVFCKNCLQDFYKNAIDEGDLAAVRCLEPSCAKQREAAQAAGNRKRRKPKTFISPSELLQIPLQPETVRRYVTLKYKTELESDKNTIYCPRTWCQGAAKSKKHKKPEGFQLHEAEDSENEDEIPNAGSAEASKSQPRPFNIGDRLAVCEDCAFAFCNRCYQSWHGEFVTCDSRRDKEELNEEEKASLEFINLHTTPCPTCSCPAQKTQGCNHMICYKCQTHFCYLCSAWLDPLNPYQHFNKQPDGRVTSCYMRLWELEEGDENGQFLFQGGQAAGEAQAVPDEQELQAIVELEDAIQGDVVAANGNVDAPRGRAVLNENGGQVDVAQEGPLVLRLGPVAAPARGGRGGQQPQAPAAAAVRQQPARGGQNRNRGNLGGARQQQPQAGGQRGRGRGGRGRGAGHREQDQVAVFRRRNIHAPVRGDVADPQQDEVQERDAAWIRNFIRLALDDEEHRLEDD